MASSFTGFQDDAQPVSRADRLQAAGRSLSTLGEHDVRLALEVFMYVAFSAAALPFAWLGLNDIVVFHSHPEMLESRDSAPVVMSVYWATRIMLPALACAVLSALYFLIAGPHAARVGGAVLLVAWLMTFLLGFFFLPQTSFSSFARVYWDAVPFVMLVVLPWLYAGVRFVVRKKTATVTTDA